MKIIYLGTSDSGGAGRFIHNLQKATLKRGHPSALLVREKTSADQQVIQVYRPYLLGMLLDLLEYVASKLFRFKTNPEYYFYSKFEKFSRYPAYVLERAMPFKPDIIMVGWISGFINYRVLYELSRRTNAKVVFYLTDMGNITGGCHYDMHCGKYQSTCEDCPAIVGPHSKSWAAGILAFKKKYIRKMAPHVFPGTGILWQQARASFLFRDVRLFDRTNAPVSQAVFNQRLLPVARQVLEVSREKRVIFLGSSAISEPRKGFRYLAEALGILKNRDPEFVSRVQLLILGSHFSEELSAQLSGYDIKYIGYVRDELMLSMAYQASDIFVCPTVYDSGPMMVMESLLCGTPVVAFDVGVSSDMVESGVTGYRAPEISSAALAEGIEYVLGLSEDDYRQMRDTCVTRTEKLCGEEAMMNRILHDLESIVPGSSGR